MFDEKRKAVIDHILYKTVVMAFAQDRVAEQRGPKSDYISATHAKISGLHSLLKTLQTARILVAELHPDIDTCKSRVSQVDLLRYHIENYFLRISSYKDLVFQLINVVYQWGIKNDMGLNNHVMKRAGEANCEDVVKLGSNLKVLLERVSPIRNRIAHEGSMVSELTFIEGTDYLSNIFPEMVGDPEVRDLFLKKLIEDNLREMMQIEEDLATNLLIVLDLLYPVYSDKVAS